MELAATEHKRLEAVRDIELLGPAPAFHEQAGGNYRWHIIVRAARRAPLVEIARGMPATWQTDLDPINLL